MTTQNNHRIDLCSSLQGGEPDIIAETYEGDEGQLFLRLDSGGDVVEALLTPTNIVALRKLLDEAAGIPQPGDVWAADSDLKRHVDRVEYGVDGIVVYYTIARSLDRDTLAEWQQWVRDNKATREVET